MTTGPTVGRIVHYTLPGDYQLCRAALVTDVHPDATVALTVFSPSGQHHVLFVDYDPGNVPGTWHWPERTG